MNNSNKIRDIIRSLIKERFESLLGHLDNNVYEILWISYFSISNDLFEVELPDNICSKLLLSIKNNKQELFSYDGINIYQKIQSYSSEGSLLEHLKVFNRSKNNKIKG